MTAIEPSTKKSKGSYGMQCSYALRILQMCLFCCAFREKRKGNNKTAGIIKDLQPERPHRKPRVN